MYVRYLESMFLIFKLIDYIVVGVWGMFFGKDDPEELGWNAAAAIWGEEKDEEEIIKSAGRTKQIL
jgi:OPA family hexose phosphate transport protein UhpT-like MFS transporter